MTQDRLARWIDVARGMLAKPLVKLPHVTLLTELVDTFGAKAGSWVYRYPDNRVDHDLWTPRFTLEPDAVLWMKDHLDEHPLVRWFSATADPAAQTIGRVPQCLWHPRYQAWNDILRPAEAEHHMSIPLSLHGKVQRSFVLVPHGEDFSDDDVLLARQLQGFLAGLDRQARLLAQWMPPELAPDGKELEVKLTGRELAILHLVARGLTAGAIGRRLLIKPRTVEKHLQNTYSKLNTRDKVSAVLKAQSLGLLHPPL